MITTCSKKRKKREVSPEKEGQTDGKRNEGKIIQIRKRGALKAERGKNSRGNLSHRFGVPPEENTGCDAPLEADFYVQHSETSSSRREDVFR